MKSEEILRLLFFFIFSLKMGSTVLKTLDMWLSNIFLKKKIRINVVYYL